VDFTWELVKAVLGDALEVLNKRLNLIGTHNI
jgi:hypothetical protein